MPMGEGRRGQGYLVPSAPRKCRIMSTASGLPLGFCFCFVLLEVSCLFYLLNNTHQGSNYLPNL